MPTTPIASFPIPARTLLAAAGLALAPAGAFGQGDPLSEPFPRTLGLASLDGQIGVAMPAPVSGGFAMALGPAGDLNGDGVDDLVVSAYRADGAAGATYVLFGSGTPWPAEVDLATLDGSDGFRLDGGPSEFSGCAVAGVGDINGDGLGDLCIGARASDANGQFDAGVAYVVFGRNGGGGAVFAPVLDLRALDGDDGFRVEGFGSSQRVGAAVAPAGDLNHDGFDDVAISAPGGAASRGETYVLYGRDTAASGPFVPIRSLADLGAADGVRFEGAGRWSGDTLAPAGDLNGDGIDDLAIAAPLTPGPQSSAAGRTTVVFGRDGSTGAGFPAAVELATLTDDQGLTMLGFEGASGLALAGRGDLNGDGIDDLAVAAPYAQPLGLSSGEVYVIFGSTDLGGQIELGSLARPAGIRVRGDRAWLYAGGGLALADLNGDGLDDLAVGAPGALLPPYSYGRVGQTYVLFGRDDASGGLPEEVNLIAATSAGGGVVLAGKGPDDRSGQRLAAAGDVNADGRPDLLVGAPGADAERGEAYVVFGRSSCEADLDGDGTLTIFDFLAFQNLFDLMDPAADFDGDGDFTIFDFLAFQNAFDLGCG